MQPSITFHEVTEGWVSDQGYATSQEGWAAIREAESVYGIPCTLIVESDTNNPPHFSFHVFSAFAPTDGAA